MSAIGRHLRGTLLAASLAALGVAWGIWSSLRVGPVMPAWAESVIFGVALVAGALFLLWAAEATQVDLNPGLTALLLALAALLPEWIVASVFALRTHDLTSELGWKCTNDVGPDCSLLLANTVGTTRVLMGPGVALLVFIIVFRSRQRGEARRQLVLHRALIVDVAYVALFLAYAITLPLKRTVTVIDTVTLTSIFIAYLLRISLSRRSQPRLLGTAHRIASLPAVKRWVVIVFILATFGCAVSFLARLFAQRLLLSGEQLHLDAYGLAQWAAPFATVTPELLVVVVYAWRLSAGEAVETLLRRMMQIALFLSVLPLIFGILSGSLHGTPASLLERRGLLLAMAQTALAIVVLFDLSLSVWEGVMILVLFLLQMIAGVLLPAATEAMVNLGMTAVYILIGLWLLARSFGHFREGLRDGFRTPYSELVESEERFPRPN